MSYALSVINRHQASVGMKYQIAVKNILKYLRRTKEIFFVYSGDFELIIMDYTNANFQTNHDNLKSQSGFVFMLNGGVMSWKSSKQKIIVDSTTEAKYIADIEAIKEVCWIKKFMDELGVVSSSSDTVKL